MALLDSRRSRATLLIALLGAGLAYALWPYVTGLIGAPVLVVAFGPVHRWLARRIPTGVAALLTVAFAALVIVVPGGMLVTLLVAQAQDLASGVFQPELVQKITALKLGPFAVGPQLKELSSRAAALLGSGLLTVAGTTTRVLLQLTISFFGLYYLLVDGERVWQAARPFIPFSEANQASLRERFVAVTTSTLVGTLLTAGMQGLLLGTAFALVGLPNALLWGAVTVVFAILPVVGSGMVWIPGAIFLVLQQRYLPAAFLVGWSVVLVGNIDNVIRPWVFARYASIHPFVTIIGAFAGIEVFGLLGLAIGPLAISYFFELIRMYRAEHAVPVTAPVAVLPEPSAPAPT